MIHFQNYDTEIILTALELFEADGIIVIFNGPPESTKYICPFLLFAERSVCKDERGGLKSNGHWTF